MRPRADKMDENPLDEYLSTKPPQAPPMNDPIVPVVLVAGR